jgi:hypothetical protein
MILPLSIKQEYESVPLHIFHPSPYDTITVLRSRKVPHAWLVAGWYAGLSRKDERVEGLVYRRVVTNQDKEVVLAEIRRRDKEANVSFGL